MEFSKPQGVNGNLLHQEVLVGPLEGFLFCFDEKIG